MRINGVSALPQVETPGWTVPAGEELATIYSDTYKLGLLALRLLAGDHDTTNPAHLPSTTPELLRQIITDTLTKQPQSRPLPEAWTYVLGHAIEEAQYRTKTATPANAPLAAPEIPVVHSRPSGGSAPVRPSAPPPSPSAPSRWAPPASPPASSKAAIWAAVAAVAVVIAVAAVVIAAVLAHHNTGTTSSAPQTSLTEPTNSSDNPPHPHRLRLRLPIPRRTPFSSYSSTPTTTVPLLLPNRRSVDPATQFQAFDATMDLRHRRQHGVSQPTTLQEHQQLRQQYGAKLLWSGEWTVYDHPDYWVTVVPITFSDSSGVLSWCTNNGRDRDHCAAQILSTTLGPNGTHEH